ncbi:MAG: HEAT repeat domain-containing protein [bacterium]
MLKSQWMPHGARRARLIAVFLLAAAGIAPAYGDELPPTATAPIASDRGDDTYQRLINERRSEDPIALRELSQTLMQRAMRSEDSFERWAGLRTARFLRDPTLAAAARAQLHSGSRYEEALALEILQNSDPENSRSDFIAALESPYRTVRLRALRALRPHSDETLVARVSILATSDSDPDIRVLAVRILQQWSARGAIAPLRRGLRDPVPAVQQETVRALVALGDSELTAMIRQRIETAPPEERVAVLRLASLVPRRELLVAIGPFLGDADVEVRVAAAGAVIAITQTEGHP